MKGQQKKDIKNINKIVNKMSNMSNVSFNYIF